MLLKKQTVWLLTMLSLVVVLSVYYILQEPNQSNMAGGENESEYNFEVTTDEISDELFEALRLEMEDKRSKKLDDLRAQVASADLTVDEKNQYLDEIQEITEYRSKEENLESLIKSLGYENALVRAGSGEVKVTVKNPEHSKKDAAQIIRIVKEQLGNQVAASVVFE